MAFCMWINNSRPDSGTLEDIVYQATYHPQPFDELFPCYTSRKTITTTMNPSLSAATQLIGHSCKTWGLFQVINHDISKNLLDEIESVGNSLFFLPMHEKLKRPGRPMVCRVTGLLVSRLSFGNTCGRKGLPSPVHQLNTFVNFGHTITKNSDTRFPIGFGCTKWWRRSCSSGRRVEARD